MLTDRILSLGADPEYMAWLSDDSFNAYPPCGRCDAGEIGCDGRSNTGEVRPYPVKLSSSNLEACARMLWARVRSLYASVERQEHGVPALAGHILPLGGHIHIECESYDDIDAILGCIEGVMRPFERLVRELSGRARGGYTYLYGYESKQYSRGAIGLELRAFPAAIWADEEVFARVMYILFRRLAWVFHEASPDDAPIEGLYNLPEYKRLVARVRQGEIDYCGLPLAIYRGSEAWHPRLVREIDRMLLQIPYPIEDIVIYRYKGNRSSLPFYRDAARPSSMSNVYKQFVENGKLLIGIPREDGLASQMSDRLRHSLAALTDPKTLRHVLCYQSMLAKTL